MNKNFWVILQLAIVMTGVLLVCGCHENKPDAGYHPKDSDKMEKKITREKTTNHHEKQGSIFRPEIGMHESSLILGSLPAGARPAGFQLVSSWLINCLSWT